LELQEQVADRRREPDTRLRYFRGKVLKANVDLELSRYNYELEVNTTKLERQARWKAYQFWAAAWQEFHSPESEQLALCL
jgi:hypothetical protein